MPEVNGSSELLNALLNRIAEKHLGLETLETRHSDRLDFHELAVWQVREALEVAFKAGVEMGVSLSGTT